MRSVSVLVLLSALLAACSTQPPVEIGQADRLGVVLVGPVPEAKTFGSIASQASAAYRRNLLYGLLYAPMTMGASIFMSPAFGHADAKDMRACLEPYFQRRPDLGQELAAADLRERPHGDEVLDEFERVWRAIYPGGGRVRKIADGTGRDAVERDAAAHRIDELFEISLTKLAIEYDHPCVIDAHVDLELRVIRVVDRTELLHRSQWVQSPVVESLSDMDTMLTVPGKLKQEYLSAVGQAFGDFFHNCNAGGRCGPPYPLHVAETPEK